MTSFAKKLDDAKSVSIELVLAKNMQGENIFAYVAIPKSEKEDFRKRLESPGVDISTLGHVIFSGFGDEPSLHIKNKINDIIEGKLSIHDV